MATERYSSNDFIKCFECGATETVDGKPLVFIGTHLKVDGLTYAEYLKKYPDAPTYSITYRRSRQMASNDAHNLRHVASIRQSNSDSWKDITTTFNASGYLTTADAGIKHNIKQRTLVMAVLREIVTPDGYAMTVNQNTGEIGKGFYLFLDDTIVAYKEKRRRSPSV